MSETTFQLDDSLAGAIATECLDGRKTLLDDLRLGFHAKAVLAEREHSQTTRRTGTVWRGDMEIRETARMTAAGFHYLYQTYGADEMNGDDLLNYQISKNPEVAVHYVPRQAKVFFPSERTHQIIQASKYTPDRA